MPIWFWAALGGIALGPLGLLILWGGCARGALSLLKRFAVSMILKLALTGLGFYLALKQLKWSVEPLVYGFFVGYTISLILEISVCNWKIHKHQQSAAPTG